MIEDAVIGMAIMWALMGGMAMLIAGTIYLLDHGLPLWAQILVGALIVTAIGAGWGIAVTP
jgi:hypothetical protein